MKVVFDTNVLVSALLSPAGAPSQVLRLALQGRFRPCVDLRLEQEYEEVLARPRLKIARGEALALLDFFRHESVWVAAEPLGLKLPDPSDLPFLEVAVSAQALYVVSGNLRHFPPRYRGVRVVSPSQLLEIWLKESR